MRKKIELICPECKSLYYKDLSEHNRNINLNRISYCSLKCFGKNSHIMKNRDLYKKYDISKHCKDSIDDLTPFRYYLKLISSKNRKFPNIELNLYDLKYQWEKQNGICPYSNISLIPITHSTNAIYKYDNPFLFASIDRIDSNIGYTKDNIEFVSIGINLMKSNFTKQQTLDFIKLLQVKLQPLKDSNFCVLTENQAS